MATVARCNTVLPADECETFARFREEMLQVIIDMHPSGRIITLNGKRQTRAIRALSYPQR